jgi:hypothetical protein
MTALFLRPRLSGRLAMGWEDIPIVNRYVTTKRRNAPLR